MPMKRYKAEQIVTLLRQIEVGIANGKPTPQACKEAEITTDLLPLAKGIRRPEAGSSQTDEGAGAGEREAEAFGGGAVSGEADPEAPGLETSVLSAALCGRACARAVRTERAACLPAAGGSGGRTQRYAAIQRIDEALTEATLR